MYWKKYELGVVLVVSLFLGVAAVVIGLNFLWPAVSEPDETAVIVSQREDVNRADETVEATVAGPILKMAQDADPVLTEAARNQPVVQVGPERGEDYSDVLLLYHSQVPTPFDTNFCEIATFYGALCEKIDLSQVNFSYDLAKDSLGDLYKLIGVSGAVFSPDYMNEGEVKAMMQAVESGNTTLLISKLSDTQSHEYVSLVTNTAVSGIMKPLDNAANWRVTSSLPEVTREFSGQTITSGRDADSEDFALIIDDEKEVTSLIVGTDNSGKDYTLFASVMLGKGVVFIDSGQNAPNVYDSTLTDAYYAKANFSQVIPTLFTLRYALQEEAWHQERNLVNFTIDDPPLWVDNPQHPLLKYLDYNELLEEMEAHNFHTTIAMPPHFWNSSEPEIVRLFLTYPNRFSIAQHGNNHDGFEFYRYTTSASDQFEARPFAEQLKNIVEGRARLKQHEYLTGIPSSAVMVFPYGTAPVDTIELLKKYNYLGLIHTAPYPLDAEMSSRIDYNMQPAIMDYGNIAMVRRREIPAWDQFYDPLYPVYELFLDKPAMIDSHVAKLFVDGMDGFSDIADSINAIEGGVEWYSPDYIFKHLYRQKLCDDGSIDVEMYARQLVLENDQESTATYHVTKSELLNVPIVSVTVNGRAFPYTLAEACICLDMTIPAHETAVIEITYDEKS